MVSISILFKNIFIIIILYICIGIRGGLVQASMRHAKANNIKTPDYDITKDKSWLIYQDCKYICFFKIFSNLDFKL